MASLGIASVLPAFCCEAAVLMSSFDQRASDTSLVRLVEALDSAREGTSDAVVAREELLDCDSLGCRATEPHTLGT